MQVSGQISSLLDRVAMAPAVAAAPAETQSPVESAAGDFAGQLNLALDNNRYAQATAIQATPGQASPSPEESARIDKAAKDMEGMFISLMMKEMWKTIPQGDYAMQGTAGEIYRDMFIDHVSEIASSGRGIGLKDMLRRDMLRHEGGLQTRPGSPAAE